MIEFLWTLQAILFLFFSEEALRKNDSWNLIFNYFGNGLDLFLRWRARANVVNEFKLIPNFFAKVGGIVLFLIFISFVFKINNHFLLIFLFSVLMFCFITIFSFQWVFKHKDTIKKLKPMAYLYGIVLTIIVINIFTNSIYPDSIVEIFRQYEILLPTQLEMALSIIYYFILMIIGYYLITWVFALIIPSSILLIFYSTSKASRLINKHIDKKIMIGLMSIVQLLVFYGFYLNS